MKFLVSMFTGDYDGNAAEKLHLEGCRKHAEEMGAVTHHLYTEALKMNSEYDKEITSATVKGALIGAMIAGLGLFSIGALGYKKFSNRQKSKKIKKEEEA